MRDAHLSHVCGGGVHWACENAVDLDGNCLFFHYDLAGTCTVKRHEDTDSKILQ